MSKLKSKIHISCRRKSYDGQAKVKIFNIKFFLKFFAVFLILVGIIFYVFGGFLIWERNNPNRLAFKSYNSKFSDVKVNNPPVRVVVKDLKIDLPILPASVKNGIWETTSDGASFLISSPVPGELGNSIIYAHDWASLFGPLVNAKSGQTVEIEFEDKNKKEFVVKDVKIVPSDQSSVLSYYGDKRITLYTCIGFLDSQRLVAVAIEK